jgi:quinol monooxygenase YgiN
MELIDNDNAKGDKNISRRDFLRDAMLAAGFRAVSPSLYGQTNKTMPNKYGLYEKFQAQAGTGKELGEILLRAATLMENAKGCILYLVTKISDNPDAIYIIEVWDSKEDHDNSLNLPGVRELITQAMPIIGGTETITLEVVGGKGLR